MAAGAGVEITSQLRAWQVNIPALEKLVAWQLGRLGCPRAGVSLLLCGDALSRRLNARFRDKPAGTDILSFPASPNKAARGSGAFLGDLALNLPYAWRKRGRFASSFGQELAFLLAHGIAHLMGFHHDTPAQEKTLETLTQRAFPAPAALARRLAFPKK